MPESIAAVGAMFAGGAAEAGAGAAVAGEAAGGAALAGGTAAAAADAGAAAMATGGAVAAAPAVGAAAGAAGGAAAAGGGSILGTLGTAAVTAGVGQVVGAALAPKAPKTLAPVAMPDPLAQQQAMQQSIIAQMARRGRAGTVLTSGGKLGG